MLFKWLTIFFLAASPISELRGAIPLGVIYYKFGPNYYRYGNLALCLFVAIPLPATGVWTGALAAWLFGIPKASAFFYMALGALAAGFIVLAATLGVVNIKL